MSAVTFIALTSDQRIDAELHTTGPAGATFTPHVDENGNLSWENNRGLANPASVNIKGPKGDRGDRGGKGDKGDRGNAGVYVGTGDMPSDCNVQIDPDGIPVTLPTEELQTAYSYILQGRNLFHDTNKGVTGWEFAQYQGAEYTLEEYGRGMKLTLTKAPTEWHYLSFNIQKVLPKLKPNTQYVLSLDLTCNTTEGISFHIMRGSATGHIADSGWIFPKGNEVVEHLVIPLKTSDFTEALDTQVLYVGVPKVSGLFLAIENLKLEHGYTSTPWCPAPEDAIEGFPELTEATAKAFDVVEQYVVDHPKEEWIDIADITTTEDVTKIEITTDINGNPFECRAIEMHGIFPEATAEAKVFSFGNDTSSKAVTVFTNIPTKTMHFYNRIEIPTQGVANITISTNPSGEHYMEANRTGWFVRSSENYPANLAKYVINVYSGNIPSGTRIKVWGLKA